LDDFIKPKKDDCLVFSFGISNDDSFDVEMNKGFGCEVHSFDPFNEQTKYQAIRRSNAALATAVKLPVGPKHTFYKIGISGNESANLNQIKIGDMLTFDRILDLTATRDKIIDVFKIDIEGPEVGVLKTMDVDYFCKHVKQFVIETHENMPGNLLFKLEKCFYLFHRDPRFFIDFPAGPTGVLTEWQRPKGFLLNLNRFKNENDLATVMYTMGELYFVNLNFLSPK
jgi:hypothetical protein